MLIETLVVGPLETNCYIAYDPETREAVVIDPGDQPTDILDVLGGKRLIPLYIINTHGHPDHLAADEEVRQATGAKILIHEDDAKIFDAPSSWLKFAFSSKVPHIDRKLKDGDGIKFGSSFLKVIHTPGHSRGSVCLYSEADAILFSGDTLFYNNYGRTDLPWSEDEKMMGSLKKLLALPSDTRVLPGHGPETTIAKERENLKGEIRDGK